MIEAKVIADSISLTGHRVTTMQVTGHRFILAEFNTHRVFSRNSASSRAIPLPKQMERVQNDPAMPLVFPVEQRGMQGGEALTGFALQHATDDWNGAAESARFFAQSLGERGVHKSIASRLLEPFMWHTIVVTATAWENFFKQRCSPLAQPEIRALAEAMKEAYETSKPKEIPYGFWHLPYTDNEDIRAVEQHLQDTYGAVTKDSVTRDLVRVSAARCAAVSYNNQERKDIEADLVRYDKLVGADPMHTSPLEHPCTPNPDNEHVLTIHTRDGIGNKVGVAGQLTLPFYGNLLGWHSQRMNVELAANYQAFA